MEKCEKEERFEEAAIARDRILKLKKIENKKIIQELNIKQAEEINQVEQMREEEVKRINEEIDSEIKRIEDEKSQAVQNLQSKHYTERDGLIEAFEAKYPNQPKFSPEVLNLQKIMDGHIKNREYEQANEIKIKILNLCEEQDTKHKLEIKSKKLNIELEKLNIKQKNEMSNLTSKWDYNLKQFEKKGYSERDKLILKFKNKIMDMKKMHGTQKIEQERINKKNEIIKPASLRLARKYFILYYNY